MDIWINYNFFNKCRSSTRVDVERVIGLLKCKFRRLKYLDILMELEIPVVISAWCVLHNFILQRESDTEPEVDTFDDIGMDASEAVADGQARPEAEEKKRAITLEL
ncbi:hypothetical protein DPMN_041594 [Dreissena polymorpha]|uniref:DDE Tnp4 domain-containing protein n=1 Tax=Dreissena polymorpha TaxID=45954 RepID=A0A9D4CZ32_DREPO|nr:hypothetical protein DPMN_041594 [Dreissena polymorpha]